MNFGGVGSEAHQNGDVSHAFRPDFVDELRQAGEARAQLEVQLALQVIDVCVLHVLIGRKQPHNPPKKIKIKKKKGFLGSFPPRHRNEVKNLTFLGGGLSEWDLGRLKSIL